MWQYSYRIQDFRLLVTPVLCCLQIGRIAGGQKKWDDGPADDHSGIGGPDPFGKPVMAMRPYYQEGTLAGKSFLSNLVS